MANYAVLGYPQPLGAKIQDRKDHSGPASYVQYAPGTTPAGDIVNASDIGMGGFDSFGMDYTGYTLSGTYLVIAKPAKVNYFSPGSANVGGSTASQFILQWFTTTGGAGTFTPASTEVTATTNLSAETVRFNVTGV